MADASTVDYMIAVYRPLEILHDGIGHPGVEEPIKLT